MELDKKIVDAFSDLMNDDKKNGTQTELYGTIVKNNGELFVKIDGSDQLTPAETTIDIGDGERVRVEIVNHKAVITGSTTSPAAQALKIIQTINGSVEQVAINADKININGVTSINEKFKVNLDGSMEASAAKISGDVDMYEELKPEEGYTWLKRIGCKFENDYFRVYTVPQTGAEKALFAIGPGEASSACPHAYTDYDYVEFGPGLVLPTAPDISGSKDVNAALRIGNPSGAHLAFDANEIMAKASGTTTTNLYLNGDGGTVYANGKPVVTSSSETVGANNTPVYLNAGVITAITSVNVAHGGTGATTAAAARTNLGITCTQLYSGTLTTGSATLTNGYSNYKAILVVGQPSSTASRCCVFIPKAVLTTSKVHYQFADESSYYSFDVWYSGNNIGVAYQGRNSSGQIIRVYGVN